MERSLVHRLVCPYCNGPFEVSKEVIASPSRLSYGLLRCRCFEFPVVDGVLLLSLSKGYGGAEEDLQPYVPLQVAAIKYLSQGDVEGLKHWIRRHIPLVGRVMDGKVGSYLHFSSERSHQLERATTDYLIRYGRYGCVGYPGLSADPVLSGKGRLNRKSFRKDPLVQRLRQLYRACCARISRRQYLNEQLLGFYARRFFAPRSAAMALQLASLPLGGKLLSLCCGHGVFENAALALGAASSIVSIDGQLLNLLVAKRYVNPDGNYICHDLQFPLPFRDAEFDGVFSSTCLPEVPTQRSLVSESLRVTRSTGWSLFDSVWSLSLGDSRINEVREYRFCQNLFKSNLDYLDFFLEIAGPSRSVHTSVSRSPRAYLSDSGWTLGHGEMRKLLGEAKEPLFSVLVAGAKMSLGAARGADSLRSLFSSAGLSFSPAYDVRTLGPSEVELSRRDLLERPDVIHASLDFQGYPERFVVQRDSLISIQRLEELFVAGALALLPNRFDDVERRVTHYLGSSSEV